MTGAPPMRRTVKLPASDVRVRDLAAILATIIAGSGLIYTAYMRGAAPSGNLAVAAFIAAAVLLFFGYGGGMLMDRLGARHPILIRRYNHPLLFIVLCVALTFALLWGWDRREQLLAGLENTGVRMLHQIDRKVEEISHMDLLDHSS